MNVQPLLMVAVGPGDDVDDFVLAVLAHDERRCFRAIDVVVSLPTLEAARRELFGRVKEQMRMKTGISSNNSRRQRSTRGYGNCICSPPSSSWAMRG